MDLQYPIEVTVKYPHSAIIRVRVFYSEKEYKEWEYADKWLYGNTEILDIKQLDGKDSN